jgi:hypothetical protein
LKSSSRRKSNKTASVAFADDVHFAPGPSSRAVEEAAATAAATHNTGSVAAIDPFAFENSTTHEQVTMQQSTPIVRQQLKQLRRRFSRTPSQRRRRSRHQSGKIVHTPATAAAEHSSKVSQKQSSTGRARRQRSTSRVHRLRNRKRSQAILAPTTGIGSGTGADGQIAEDMDLFGDW